MRRAVLFYIIYQNSRRHAIVCYHIFRNIFQLHTKIRIILLADLIIPADPLDQGEFVDDIAHLRNWNCEAHALHIRIGELGDIDTDQASVPIQQGTTAVAWIDRRIRLNQSHRTAIRRLHHAVQRADASGRYRLSKAERIADRNHALSHTQTVRITDRNRAN